MAEKRLLNIQEAADLLGVSRQKVKEMALAGDLPYLRAGADMRFPKRALENWLETGSFDGAGGRGGAAEAWVAEVLRPLEESLRLMRGAIERLEGMAGKRDEAAERTITVVRGAEG